MVKVSGSPFSGLRSPFGPLLRKLFCAETWVTDKVIQKNQNTAKTNKQTNKQKQKQKNKTKQNKAKENENRKYGYKMAAKTIISNSRHISHQK